MASITSGLFSNLTQKASLPTSILNYKTNTYEVLDGDGVLVPSTFDATHTFSRIGGGGKFNSSGLYEWQASGPRFDYDPLTLAARGLLIEGQATNLLDYSRPTAPSWTTVGTTISSSSVLLAGVLSTLVTASAGANLHQTWQSAGVSVTTGSYVVFRAIAKAGTNDLISVNSNSAVFGTQEWANIRLSTGEVTAKGTNAIVSTRILHDGSCEITVVNLSINSGPARPYFSVINNPTLGRGGTWTASGTENFYLTAVEMREISAWVPNSFIPTSGASVTRSADYSEIPSTGIKTIIMDHDVISGRPLLATGPNDLLISNGAGRSILAIDGSFIYVSHNGGAYTSSAIPTFDSTIKLLRNGADTTWGNGRIEKIITFNRKLSVKEAMAA